MGNLEKKYQVFGNCGTFVKAVIEKDYSTARKEVSKAHKTDALFKSELVKFCKGLEQFEKNILWNFFDGNEKQCLLEIPKEVHYKKSRTEPKEEEKSSSEQL